MQQQNSTRVMMGGKKSKSLLVLEMDELEQADVAVLCSPAFPCAALWGVCLSAAQCSALGPVCSCLCVLVSWDSGFELSSEPPGPHWISAASAAEMEQNSGVCPDSVRVCAPQTVTFRTGLELVLLERFLFLKRRVCDFQVRVSMQQDGEEIVE